MGRIKADTVGITRKYSHLEGAKRWTCHQWRLMKDPSNLPLGFSERALKRIQWIYSDGREIMELLKDKRFAQPGLCQVIQDGYDHGWAYYAHNTSISYWMPTIWWLYEDFLTAKDKPLLEITVGSGATKQMLKGPASFWYNKNYINRFNWIVGEPDEWLVFNWNLGWASTDADPKSDKIDYKERTYYKGDM